LALQDQIKELSALENRVRGMRSRLDAATRRRDAQQRKRNLLQQQAQELRDELQRMRAHAATLENETQAADKRVADLRDRMNAVTSNKEYSALLVEVNTLKLEKSKREDEQLEQMGRIEESEAKLKELDERVSQQEKVLEAAEAEVTAAREEVGDQLEAATAERDRAASTVPPDVLAQFEKLAEEHDGEPVAVIEEQNRRRMEYICGGCFIQLPVEHVNALMTRPDELTTCPNCHRMLLIDHELRTALAPK